MKAFKSVSLSLAVVVLAAASVVLTTACSSGGSGMSRTSMHYGAGYRGYYRQPWGYPPVYVGGGGVDPDWGVEAPDYPVATPMPEMGMPDMGGMDMDMGGFDW